MPFLLSDGTSAVTYRFGPAEYDFSQRTHIMGVLNVTPDSFSDGGMWFDPGKAVDHGMRLVTDGADFLDIGGESTRPGAEPVPAEEEIRRVIPVIRELKKRTSVPISVDTYKSDVAQKAIEAGAVIVNDITGLHHDPDIARIAAAAGVSIILMHMQGTPRTMQDNPAYDNLIEDICSYFEQSLGVARKAHVEQVIIDPGLGFGKSLEHNLGIIRHLGEFRRFGYPVMIGASRKSFIGKILDLPVGERIEGTSGAVAAAVLYGADIVRVHDVKEIKRVITVVDAIVRGDRQPVMH